MKQKKRVPSDETVIKMIEIYNANYLAYQHLKLKTQVGNAFLPDVHEVPLSNAALALIHNLHSCMEEQEEIIAITMDGNISQEELTEWQRIMKKYDDLYTADSGDTIFKKIRHSNECLIMKKFEDTA